VRRHLDALQRDGEGELAGVQDEGLGVFDRDQLGQVLVGLLDVDVGQSVVAEDAELASQAQVDAGGLEEALLPGVDNQPPGLDLFADAVVAEDGRGFTSRSELWRV
jgi:hypothetical protein